MDVDFCVILRQPPIGVDFAIQKGQGSKCEIVQTQRANGGDLQFNITLTLKSDPQKEKAPQFSGPFVQGKPLEQFFYIGVGGFAGQQGGWNRRIKIPLYGITWDMIAELSHYPNAEFKVSVPGTAKDGSPSCATIKPFDGWKVNAVSN